MRGRVWDSWKWKFLWYKDHSISKKNYYKI